MGIFDRLFGKKSKVKKKRTVKPKKKGKDVEGLINALKDEDEDVRWEAAEALDKLHWRPSDDSEKTLYLLAKQEWDALVELGQLAVEPLIQALKDEDSDVGEKVAEALGEIGDARAVEPLIQALKDEDSDVGEKVAEALGEIGDARAVEPLAALLKDEDHFVCAAMALGKMGAPAIEPLIGALKDDNRIVRRCVVEALGETGSDAAVPALIKVLTGAHVQIDVRISACEALGKLESKMSAETVKLLKQKEKELYIKEEDIAKEADTLIMLLVEAHQWGESHGFPLFEKYPQYKKIRSIGERIHSKWGFKGMQRVFDIVTTQERVVGRYLDRFWDRIGPWMA